MKKIKLYLSLFLLATNFLNAQESLKLVPFLKGSKFGFSTENKEMIIEPKFSKAYPFGYLVNNSFYPYYALIEFEKEMYLVDEKGKLLKRDDFDKQDKLKSVPPPPKLAKIKTIEYFVFEQKNKKGLKDESDNIILDPIYDNVEKIYSYDNPAYFDPKTEKYYKATYVIVKKSDKYYIIRADKFKIYEDISFLAVVDYSENIIVELLKDKTKLGVGILMGDRLIKLDPKYTQIIKFYKDSNLLLVERYIENKPVNLYINLTGVEYFER